MKIDRAVTRSRALVAALSFCALPALASPPVVTTSGAALPAVDGATLSRMRTVAASIDVPMTLADAAKMTSTEHQALVALARDPRERLDVRARALGLASAKHNGPSEGLWAEARTWPEEALRVQAAWAQLSVRVRTSAGLPFAQELLASDDVKMREVGAHGLFLVGTPEALAVARAHRTSETSTLVQKLIDRRLREAASKH